ncbi:DNA (cytosine-5)-methyltransferase DRM2 isoform X2 [Aegilops tauschii subsp. strangulata]|uniref:DNA (cytosine-5)-methyltransferase DRM2 isoform X2 n=1 Tax=Aegilops tauschii subsp. strangulata TaxID=200361 RepID=UPI003CC8D28C
MLQMVDLVSDNDEFELDEDNDGQVGGSSYPVLRNADAPGPSTLVRQDAVGMANGAAPSASLVGMYVEMGFPKEMVLKAVKEIGERDESALLSLLLAYTENDDSVGSCSTSRRIPQRVEDEEEEEEEDDAFDFEDWDDAVDAGQREPYSDGSGDEGFLEEMSQWDKQIKSLVDMGFPEDEANMALRRCGFVDHTLMGWYLMLYIWFKLGQVLDENRFSSCVGRKKARFTEDSKKRKRYGGGAHGSQSPWDGGHEESISLPKPMVGFGLPGDRPRSVSRLLPAHSMRAPFFYYENVALATKGAWAEISRCLYGIEPEFVDSKYFCAALRKRGYIHNLPTEGRSVLRPIPPKTIFEAFPQYETWWPSWDQRRQFNCLQTCMASAKLTERIHRALANSSDPPTQAVQKYVLEECRKWNLVWIGKNKVAALDSLEMEFLLGYPRDHTRGASKKKKDKCLGNSFQVDTVAFHLSVLKDRFPCGMNVLSLFSGIGGAEVALHKLGIRMKTVVSVEICDASRNILRTWWDQTQEGTLIEFRDVQSLTHEKIASLIRQLGGFDLVIGGSPCNNLAGSNRHHRVGLEGDQSVLFRDYVRILNSVKSIMANVG